MKEKSKRELAVANTLQKEEMVLSAEIIKKKIK
jgi:hypothetical protein